jgi:hypothetical protein
MTTRFNEKCLLTPLTKLPRLRLWGCGAIFSQFFQDKFGLRSQSRRAAYAIVRWQKYENKNMQYHRKEKPKEKVNEVI